MQILSTPVLGGGKNNCKSGVLIGQSEAEQHYFAPREAWNWQKFALEKWRIPKSIFPMVLTKMINLKLHNII